ncbi:uncharacterized protein LOC119900125 isoform X3 [Micropterus salmoides]|uniref:uncharacterized protein LOC119900125 isoform X3 n=1 Tax=Micropterus salmoides TaxID=27706 RepID=UPI0018EB72F7|nr:uncharacterized protein LOC119900125 isoform X3 [Micropterus salmoides]
MEDGSSSATLVCSAEFRQPQSLMKLEWDSHGHVQPGPNFTISLGDKHDDEIYTCRVSNPLSNETATYTAKDCYPACFAKRKKGDSENPSTKGSDEKTAQGDENRSLLERAPTLPSTQPLGLLLQSNRNLKPNGLDRDHNENVNSDWKTVNAHDMSPPKGLVEQRKQQFENDGNISDKKLQKDDKGDADANEPEPAGVADKEDLEVFIEPEQPVLETALSEPDSQHSGLDNKGDANADHLSEDAGKKIPQCDPSDSEKANELDPAGLLEDSQSNLESSIAPVQPAHDMSPPKGLVEQRKQQFENDGNISDKKLHKDDKGDADANELDPAGLLEDSQSNLESSIAPVQPAHDMSPPKGLVEQRKQQFENDGNISDKKLHKDDKGDADANEPEPAGVADKEDLEVFIEPEQPVLETALSEPDSQHSGLDNKGDANADHLSEDAGKKIPQCDPSDSEKANELDPAGLLEDSQSNLESSIAPVQPAHDMSPPKGLVEQRKQQFENDGNISDKKLHKDDKGDADANEPEPAGVADKEDLEVFSEPEQPVLETALSEPDSQHSESKKKTDDEEEA